MENINLCLFQRGDGYFLSNTKTDNVHLNGNNVSTKSRTCNNNDQIIGRAQMPSFKKYS